MDSGTTNGGNGHAVSRSAKIFEDGIFDENGALFFSLVED